MAPLLEDPRFRQTWNQFSQNAESATETAAANIWSFQHQYITPCVASIGSGFEQCTGQCFPDREERARRQRERGRTRGRAELSFDFYDDWDEDDGGDGRGLLGGWGNDELDRLLAGSGSHSGISDPISRAPRRKRGMSYGTRGLKKSLDPDPTIIPSTSALGFLDRLPFKLRGTLRYKPSAADLQEHPGQHSSGFRDEEEGEPLISEEHSEDDQPRRKGHTRNRSDTASSGETTDSFRSRGDLFPSDGEDDAVPLDDEFAMVLERRTTQDGDHSSADTRLSKGKRPSGSRNVSSRNVSRGTQSSRPSMRGMRFGSSASLAHQLASPTSDMVETPSLSELQHEDERVRIEEEAAVERKREAAAELARERGLHFGDASEGTVSERKDEQPASAEAITPSAPLPRHETESKEVTPPESAFVPARLPYFG